MKSRSMAMMVMGAAFFLFAGTAWAGSLSIKGSTTVFPVTQKVAEAYMQQNPNVRITIEGGGSGTGIKAIIDGLTDVAMSSRFIRSSEVAMAMEKGRYPVPFSVAYDCIVPVVHLSNTLTNISQDQLKRIYMGEIKNWKELGGPDAPVVVISRDTSSGTYEVWSEQVLKGDRVFPAALLQASSGAVVQAVSRNRNAIGYIGIGYITSELKPLTVNGVPGTPETTLNGTYPVSRPLFMFTQGWPTGEALSFMNFMLHPEKGQKYVSEAGFVPLY